MNLKNKYETDDNLFIIVVISVLVGAMVMFLIIGCSLKNAGLFGSRLTLDLPSAHHSEEVNLSSLQQSTINRRSQL